MAGGAGTWRAVIQLTGTRLRQRNQLPDVAHRQRGMHHQSVRHVSHQRNRREIVDRIVRQRFAHTRVDDMRSRHHADGIAVRRRLGEHRRTQRAAGAAAIVDQDLLPQFLGHFRRNGPCNDVGIAARRKRYDQPDRFGRPVLGMTDAGHCQSGGNNDGTVQAMLDHLLLHSWNGHGRLDIFNGRSVLLSQCNPAGRNGRQSVQHMTAAFRRWNAP